MLDIGCANTVILLMLIYRSGLSVKINEYPLHDGLFFKDENMTVRVVELKPSNDATLLDSDRDSDKSMEQEQEQEQGTMKRKHDDIADASSGINTSTDEAIALKRQFIDIMFPGQQSEQKRPIAIVTSSENVTITCPSDPVQIMTTEQLLTLRKQFGQRMPRTRPTRSALCYIGQGNDVPGRFDPKAAIALGLKPGPIFGMFVL
jgi:ribonuclease Z